MHLFPAGAGQVVSIHAPAWGATNAFAFRAYNYIVFQSTHPRGVRRTIGAKYFSTAICFNPRTRVGCDSPPTNRIFAAQEFQSTHPRGVRLAALLGLSIRVTVSIHAPAWGATRQETTASKNDRCFNPRTRVGCDERRWQDVETSSCFNPRTRVGCDASSSANLLQGVEFQSTHPRGVRRTLPVRASSS